MANKNKEHGTLLEMRDAKMKQVSELQTQMSRLRGDASHLERDYINNKFINQYGINPGVTKVRYKQSNEVGVIMIISNTPISRIGTISMYIQRGYTQLAEGLSFWRAAFFPLTKKGKPSEIESKVTKTRCTETIDEFISMFEIVSEEE